MMRAKRFPRAKSLATGENLAKSDEGRKLFHVEHFGGLWKTREDFWNSDVGGRRSIRAQADVPRGTFCDFEISSRLAACSTWNKFDSWIRACPVLVGFANSEPPFGAFVPRGTVCSGYIA